MSRLKAYGYIKLLEAENNCEEKQKDAIKGFAEDRDIEVVRFYRENEISQSVFQKLALSELLLDLEDNDEGIRTLLVEKMDQLAKDLTVQSSIIWELRSQGFEVISALETVYGMAERDIPPGKGD
jgi:DNA invertase Pin-like site-specific DNA recombinase